MNKKDPICGMPGTIPLYKHYFCSDKCIAKYEKQKGITPRLSKRPWFKPALYVLIIILIIKLLIVLQKYDWMLKFMGIFFIIVSLLKFLDWKGFAQAFAKYDLLAKKSKLYALAYPLIELGLGVAYLLVWQITFVAVVTFFIMTVGAVGVGKNLLAEKPMKCACLGTKIKVPLTKFTFFEDIVMAIMALMILIL